MTPSPIEKLHYNNNVAPGRHHDKPYLCDLVRALLKFVVLDNFYVRCSISNWYLFCHFLFQDADLNIQHLSQSRPQNQMNGQKVTE